MRFSINTTSRIPKLFLTAQTVNPPRFQLHVPNESIADKQPKHPEILQEHCKMKRANLAPKMGPKRVSPEWYCFGTKIWG